MHLEPGNRVILGARKGICRDQESEWRACTFKGEEFWGFIVIVIRLASRTGFRRWWPPTLRRTILACPLCIYFMVVELFHIAREIHNSRTYHSSLRSVYLTHSCICSHYLVQHVYSALQGASLSFGEQVWPEIATAGLPIPAISTPKLCFQVWRYLVSSVNCIIAHAVGYYSAWCRRAFLVGAAQRSAGNE